LPATKKPTANLSPEKNPASVSYGLYRAKVS
jgi:hypothetical protein